MHPRSPCLSPHNSKPANPHPSAPPSSHLADAFLQRYTVHSSLEESRLLTHLLWRQSTSMPIVKVLSFSRVSGPPQARFPCLYTVCMEPTLRDITTLKRITIGEAVYMIKECLLGAQTLSLKLGEHFQLSNTFVSINHRGQVKVWLNNALMVFLQDNSKQLKSQLNNTVIAEMKELIEGVCHFVQGRLKKQEITTFKMFKSGLLRNGNLSYSSMHCHIKNLCEKLKITVPNCLNLTACFSQSPSDSNASHELLGLSKRKPKRKDSSLTKNHSTLYHPKRRFASPIKPTGTPYFLKAQPLTAKKKNSTHTQLPEADHVAKQRQPLSKPKLNYEASIEKLKEQIKYYSSRKCKQIRGYSLEKRNQDVSMENLPKRPQFLDNKQKKENEEDHLEPCITILKPTPRSPTSHQPFSPYNHLAESGSSNEPDTQPYNPIRHSSLKTLQLNCTDLLPSLTEQSLIGKKSLATTLAGSMNSYLQSRSFACRDSLQDGNHLKDRSQLASMVEVGKNIMNSLMVPITTHPNNDSTDHAYNFGGLLEVSKSSSSINEIEGRESESLKGSQRRTFPASQPKSFLTPQMAEPQNQMLQDIKKNFESICGVSIVHNILSEDKVNLKQSIEYCEIKMERKQQVIHSKLQKLNKLGREIFSSNMQHGTA